MSRCGNILLAVGSLLAGLGFRVETKAFYLSDRVEPRVVTNLCKALPLPLNRVRLTGGPLQRARELDARYLLELEPDRMLALLRESAGLKPKAEPYGGWDGRGRQLSGHIAGHYLSAVSLMYAATGDERFKQRADYLVAELQEIQRAHGDGYLGAQTDGDGTPGKRLLEEMAQGRIRAAAFDLNGLWAPWYVHHKLFAGLRDAYRLTGNRTALEVERAYAGWVERVLTPLSDEQVQTMLRTEFGGMNEVLVDLYADTGEERWLRLAEKFHHRAVVDPLAEGRDILQHLHGNTQVPKLYGHLVRYLYTGDPFHLRAATFFWERVVLHHSFATGGHGRNEYFGAPDRLSDMIEGRTAETCNVYNMLKLTRGLFAVDPQVRYAEFLERALFNHILASMDPEDGRVCYMVPVGRDVQHEYQDMFRSFTCCVGTGMESHALHGHGLYYESGDTLWINFYAPSEADWTRMGVRVRMETDFPAGETATVRVDPAGARSFTLALRRPAWAGAGFAVEVNGTPVSDTGMSGSYLRLSRTWRDGDTVKIRLPKTLREEPLPDNPHRVALLWGPLVLAADLGPATEGRRRDGRSRERDPAEFTLVVSSTNVADWLEPVPGAPGTFRTRFTASGAEVTFRPFYQVARRRYAVYWDRYTPEAWARERALREEQAAARRRLEAATVVYIEPGNAASEEPYRFQGEGSSTVRVEGRSGRRADRWFSYEVPLTGPGPWALVVTYGNDAPRDTTFAVWVNEQKVGEQTVRRRSPEELVRFVDVTYALPESLWKGRESLVIRFEAPEGQTVAGVFGVRLIRQGAAP
ncbi:hypothetical protein G4L39_01615 [Limisphaera ngatamarikiensis]|uniref:Glycoside hydrolase family 127 protein n=1 Tax=Limisphaera ngatamarikiensis TaxID=1324935 RepID=A0A6M1RES1_9BACT|nr:glycoside hydrolase family 127 protein [Limisphaera ngatamarikiensis]NGO38096.1 hypothetical protein [Limisphaera ngatamarikiensis]